MISKKYMGSILDSIAALCILYCTLVVLLPGCATTPRPMLECKNLCLGDRVEEFKDETTTCRCVDQNERINNE